jgi:hypothetical protein
MISRCTVRLWKKPVVFDGKNKQFVYRVNYFSADLAAVQAFHSSSQSVCVCVNVLKIERFHVMMVIPNHGHIVTYEH